MKRTAVISAILFAVAISGNLHSAEKGGGIVTPEDFYCGYDVDLGVCTWVLEGSVCITNADCKPLVATPPGGRD